MYGVILSGFILYMILIFTLSMIVNIHIVWIIALAIGLMYGILLPAWNPLWHDLSNQMNKKKLGVF